MIIAIDPGPKESALVLYDATVGLCAHYRAGNDWIVSYLGRYHAQATDTLVIEQIASYGMPVGAEVFTTCVWSGRFWQEWTRRSYAAAWLTRGEIKVYLCGDSRAKDSNVRQALIDRFGGPESLKKNGPLYKVAKDTWQALAVAVAYVHHVPPRSTDAATAGA